jgi:hypothetical protein
MLRTRPSAAPAIATALLLVGCGEGGPRLVPVDGTVTFNGEPLDAATVTFIPEATNAEQTSGVDVSDPRGRFRIKYNDRTGLAPGRYKVLVDKKFIPKGVKVPETFKDNPGMLTLPEMGFTRESLPKDYLDPASSPLSAEVADAGGTFAFDVKGKPVKP